MILLNYHNHKQKIERNGEGLEIIASRCMKHILGKKQLLEPDSYVRFPDDAKLTSFGNLVFCAFRGLFSTHQ